jgi:hypothetical protein
MPRITETQQTTYVGSLSATELRAIGNSITFVNLPESSVGLQPGAIWNDGGILKVIPTPTPTPTITPTPTPTITPTPTPSFDPDAQTYINNVEAADGQALETSVKTAIDNFITGCKADNIWNAIKSSCILAGARTLNGALVPLKGTAPTNNNFVAGDYSRSTGLIGNGTTKYLNSNRAANADPQDNLHFCAYLNNFFLSTTQKGIIGQRVGGSENFLAGQVVSSTETLISGVRSATNYSTNITNFSGLYGCRRSSSTEFILRKVATPTEQTITDTSIGPSTANYFVFAINESAAGTNPTNYSDFRTFFYSIGENINFTLLNSRLATLFTAYSSL